MNRAFTLWTHRPVGAEGHYIRIGEPFAPLDKVDWPGVLCQRDTVACRFRHFGPFGLIMIDPATSFARMERRAA